MSLKLIELERTKIKIVIREEKKIINLNFKDNKNLINIGNYPILDTKNIIVQRFVMANITPGLEIYANDGITLVAKIDNDGNLGIKGQMYTL